VRDLDVCWFASDLLGKEIEKERFNASINNVFTLRAKTKPIGRQQQ
jgi:hypothetical protein